MGRFTLLTLKIGVVTPPHDQPDAPVGLVVYDETRTWGTLDVTQEQWSTLALAITGTREPRLQWSGPMGPVDVTIDHAIAAEESMYYKVTPVSRDGTPMDAIVGRTATAEPNPAGNGPSPLRLVEPDSSAIADDSFAAMVEGAGLTCGAAPPQLMASWTHPCDRPAGHTGNCQYPVSVGELNKRQGFEDKPWSPPIARARDVYNDKSDPAAIVMDTDPLEEPEPWLADERFPIPVPDAIAGQCLPCHTGLGGRCQYPVTGGMCGCPCPLCKEPDAIADDEPDHSAVEMRDPFEAPTFIKLTSDEIARLHKADVLKPQDDHVAAQLRSLLGDRPVFVWALYCTCGVELSQIGFPVPDEIACVCGARWEAAVGEGGGVTLTVKEP